MRNYLLGLFTIPFLIIVSFIIWLIVQILIEWRNNYIDYMETWSYFDWHKIPEPFIWSRISFNKFFYFRRSLYKVFIR